MLLPESRVVSMIVPGTMHYNRRIAIPAHLQNMESKQKKFGDKNYRLQKLIHILWYIRSDNINLRFFYHDWLRMTAQQP